MTDVTVPDEREKQISEALALLKLRQDTSRSTFSRIAGELKLYALSEEVRSLAEARLRGEQRPTPELRDLARGRDDQARVASEWANVIKELAQRKAAWAEPALDSEIRFQTALINYDHALEPLFTGLGAAKGSGVPGVTGNAEKVLATLQKARDTLQPVSEQATKAVQELTEFNLLIDGELTKEPPKTLAEVRGTRARFAEGVQAIRNSEDAIKKQTAALDRLCKSSQQAVENNIKAMVVAALAWRETEDLREGTEWVQVFLNGGVGALQVLAVEPLSAVAVQGLHMLIKGACDGISAAAASIKAYSISQEEALSLVAKLKGDDFIKLKIDAIQKALEWAAEPIGFIPSVGTLIRTVVTSAGSLITGALKKAAEKQAKAADPRQANVDEEITEVKGILKDTILGEVKVAVESGAESIKDFAEYVKGAKDPSELLISIVTALLGPSLQTMLADIIPAFELASPDQIRTTLLGSRDAVTILANENLEMSRIQQDFGFDEATAKAESSRALGALGEGQGCWVTVAASPVFESTRGVALLIGSAHSENNSHFVDALIQEGSGAGGTVTMKSKPGLVMSGELVFNFNGDARAEKMVRDYIEHYGSAFTGQTLTFEG
jgi:hypothetical protein